MTATRSGACKYWIGFSRTLTPEQQGALDALRRQAVAQLELRQNVDQLAAGTPQARSGRGGGGSTRSGAAGRARWREATQCVVAILLGLSVQHRHSGRSRCHPHGDRWVAAGTPGTSRGWPDTRDQIELALQEALANAIRHGCQGDPTKFVQCCVTYEDAGQCVNRGTRPGGG